MSHGIITRPRTPRLLEGCRIYVHDTAAATGLRLHERFTPCGWPHVQHADEAWLSQALQSSPWRVSTPAAADLIYLDGHDLSRWCTATRIITMRKAEARSAANVRSEVACEAMHITDSRKAQSAEVVLRRRKARAEQPGQPATPLQRDERSKHVLWDLMLQTAGALQPSNRTVPRVVALTSMECPPPFFPEREPSEQDVVLLVDQAPREFDVVTPYVVSQPGWLVGSSPPPPMAPWTERRLLFFAGHVPKLSQSVTRYMVWKQLRRSEHVTALSSTIGCNVAAYEVCASASRVANEWQSFCRGWCGSQRGSYMRCSGSAAMLQKQCERHYAGRVNFTDERADLLAASRRGRLSHEEYLRMASSHRFCLVAPGDFVSTHKITEAMALGGAGGCIPVFVLRGKRHGAAAASMLPFTRWLDYCEVAFLVDEQRVQRDAEGMVRALLRVTDAEAAAKLGALRRVRDAFVFRAGSNASSPSAAEYILEEACAAAKQYRRAGFAHRKRGSLMQRYYSMHRWWSRRARFDLQRCTL